jgi:hypothetical protein
MNMSFALVNQGPARKALVILPVDAILAPSSDFLWYEMVWTQSRLRSMVCNWFGRDLGSIPRYATGLDACCLHAVEPYRRSYTCQCPARVYALDLAGGKVNKQIPPACCNIVSVNC